MRDDVAYTPRERLWLSVAAVLGLVAVNGAFLYGLARPEAMRDALTNPVSLAFVVEALLLTGLLAYLLRRWGVLRVAWGWLVALSLLGSLLFALPFVLLWGERRSRR
jgi:hypothetical protein